MLCEGENVTNKVGFNWNLTEKVGRHFKRSGLLERKKNLLDTQSLISVMDFIA